MTNTQRILQRNTLQAVERLKLRKQIETLFQSGEAFSLFPLRVIYRLSPINTTIEPSPVRVGFSVPKKRTKRANDRNAVKRLLKEAWRTNKHPLYHAVPQNKQLHCFLVFTGQYPITIVEAQKCVTLVVQKLIKILEKLPPHV